MTIRFIRDTTLLINNSIEVSYEEIYKKNSIEYVDLLDETESSIYVQFENGEVSCISKDSFEYEQ
jgi:hypothetical protein